MLYTRKELFDLLKSNSLFKQVLKINNLKLYLYIIINFLFLKFYFIKKLNKKYKNILFFKFFLIF